MLRMRGVLPPFLPTGRITLTRSPPTRPTCVRSLIAILQPTDVVNGTNASNAAPLRTPEEHRPSRSGSTNYPKLQVRGHRAADVDPLGAPKPHLPELSPSTTDSIDRTWTRKFSSRTMCGEGVLTLREILTRLRNTYCRSIGVQFMHIDDLGVRELAAGADGGDRESHRAQPRTSSSASSRGSPTP